jgi:hypothetical protein
MILIIGCRGDCAKRLFNQDRCSPQQTPLQCLPAVCALANTARSKRSTKFLERGLKKWQFQVCEVNTEITDFSINYY